MRRHKNHSHVRVQKAAPPDELQPVERAKADVGDEQVVRVEFEQTLGSVEGGGARYGVSGVAEQFQHAGERTLIIFDDKDLVRQHCGDTFLPPRGGRRKGYARCPNTVDP